VIEKLSGEFYVNIDAKNSIPLDEYLLQEQSTAKSHAEYFKSTQNLPFPI